ncbi:hypothetical protein QJU93_09130 [Pasteurella skyensis]|uniref:Uncharacterized protein n=2 Tax=Phocoenobacter skyensis TaxID=97481 RepID=A0AAJ6NB45_9PAST|nr:hypothetical protein [Pasteurella skyensis]MDP8163314.1 hypothetical protein [Pasteurella skyensis]MDP8173515.1 hypothetical protein [Pasteurella skyensis]MDP8179756.1 hypothetical protein [Pasteurella skyensis]
MISRLIMKAKYLQRIAEIRNDLFNMSDQLSDELYSILKQSKDRTVSAAVIQALYIAQTEFAGMPILYFGRISDALADKYEDTTDLYILDIFGVEDVGVFVTGYAIGGEIQLDDKLLLEKADGRDIPVTCTEVTEHPSKSMYLKIDGVALSEVSQGDRLVKQN